MDKKFIFKGLAITLSAAAVLGCVKNPEETLTPDSPLSAISFGAGTSYQNDIRTRTEYSGLDESNALISSTSQYERIDWVAGADIVRILCQDAKMADGTAFNSHSDLKVGSVNVNPGAQQQSLAGTSLVDGDQMYWGSGQHSFYGLYPAPGTKSNYNPSWVSTGSDASIAPISGDKARITAAVPATQESVKSDTIYKPNMNYAFLYAAEKVNPNSGDVVLHFKPLVTTIQFSFKALDHWMTEHDLTSLTLASSSTKLWGDFTAELNAANGTAGVTLGATTGSSVTLNFPTGSRLSDTRYSVATVLMLPVNQTDLTLTLTFDGGLTRSIPLNSGGTPIKVGACKKAYIKLGVPMDMDSIFEVTPVIVFEYTGGSLDGAVRSRFTSIDEPLSWQIEGYYTDADCTTPVPAAALNDGIPAWLTSFNGGATGGAGTTGTGSNPVPVVCPQQTPTVTETISAEAQEMNNRLGAGPVGSWENPKNLSNPSYMDSAVIEESANCYVANAVGYYKIPLVMGNGVKNGALNPDETTYKGFQGNNTDDFRVLFRDYKGNAIQDPHLHKSGAGVGVPTSAYIIWEDIDGLIEAEDYDLPDCITYDSGTDCYWLRFHVAKRQQGNATIAVRDADGTIMWSYHIWVSDYVPKSPEADVTFTNKFTISDSLYTSHQTGPNKVEREFQMALGTRVIGQVLYGQTFTTAYPENTVWVKFKQDATGKEKIMKVIQHDHEDKDVTEWGHPTYQWGRKDALWPNDGDKNRTWYGKSPSFQTMQGPVSMQNTILNPDKYYLQTDNMHLSPVSATQNYAITWVGGTLNLWTYSYMSGSTFNRCYASNMYNAANKIALFGEAEWVGLMVTSGSDVGYIGYYVISPQSYQTPVKTIWDPNPAGYVVPNKGLHQTLNGSNYDVPSINYRPTGLKDNHYIITYGSSLRKGTTGATYWTHHEHTGGEFTLPTTGKVRLDSGEITGAALNYISAVPGEYKSGNTWTPVKVYFQNNGTNGVEFRTLYPSNAFASLPVREGIGPDEIFFPGGNHQMLKIYDWIQMINASSGTAGSTEPFTYHYENPNLQ